MNFPYHIEPPSPIATISIAKYHDEICPAPAMTSSPFALEPPHFSTLKPITPPCPPPIYSQPNIKIKRKPISKDYSHSYHISLSSTLTSNHGLEGLEVVESHGPEVSGGDGLIYMRDDYNKHPSIQLPSTDTCKIYDEEGGKKRRRICGMNLWTVIALVVILVIGAVVGGVVGAVKGRNGAADLMAATQPASTPDPVPAPQSLSTALLTPTTTPTSTPKPKPRLPQPVDSTWYHIGTSNPSLSSNATGLYLARDSGGALRSYPPSPGFEQDQTFRFKSFQPSSAPSSTNKITQTWSAAQINFQTLYNISRETPLYILQHPLANWSAILRYTNENGLGDLYLESAAYGNVSSAAVDFKEDGLDGASKHNDPGVWFWLEDRDDGKGFWLKNAAAGKEKALTLLNYNGKDQLVMSDLGLTGVRRVDEEGSQAWNITETPKVEAYDWPYEW